MTIHDEDSRLTANLRELAQADASLEAPARVDQAIVAHWDRMEDRSTDLHPIDVLPRRSVTSRRSWRVVAIVGAAAAMLILGVTFGRRAPRTAAVQQTPAESIARVGMLPQTHTAPDTRAALSETGPEPARQRSRGPAPSRRPPPDLDEYRAPDDVAVFVPLVPLSGQERDEAVQVIRVRLSRSALLGFGVPIDEDRSADSLQADVLLGEDGLARGIRFVKN